MTREEAIKIVRNIYQTDAEKEALAVLIPQLRESEDERIRKGLIEALKASKTVGELKFVLPYPTREECIAYLKKQKELFESGRGLYYYDGEKTIYCGYPATEENPYDFAMSQQEKQKPVDNKKVEMTDFEQSVYDLCPVLGIEEAKATASDLLELAKKTLLKTGKVVLASNYPEGCSFEDGFHLGYNEGFNAKQKEQIQEVEDDLDKEIHRFFDECIDVHEAKLYGSFNERVIPVDCYELIARHFAEWGKKQKEQKPAEWTLPKDFEEAVYKVANFISPFDNQEELRKTSHRFAEQLLSLAKKELDKPAEWSEEDEDMRLEAIRVLVSGCERYRKESGCLPSWSKVINWLKSLRPVSKESLQPHWKPSEEQMKAFKGYIEDFQARAKAAVGGWNNFDVMIRLYEQLKKLM